MSILYSSASWCWCGYILTELGSIVENAGALGAPIPGWLAAAIKVLGSSVDQAGEAVTGDQDDNSSE